VGGGGETERGKLWAGGELIAGKVDDKDLRRMDRGIRFLARAEAAGMGGEQGRRTTGEAGAGVVESRGGGNIGDVSAGEGAKSTSSSGCTCVRIASIKGEGGGVSGMSGGGEGVSGVSSRAGTGEGTGEGTGKESSG